MPSDVSRVSSHPQVSVVVRSYNEPPSIFKECLDSIIGQQGVSLDLIVVDSSATSEIRDLCQTYPQVRYHYISSTGLSDGRNKGLEVAKHDLVAFTDPDCVAAQFWLKSLAEEFTPGVAIAGGKVMPRWLSEPPLLFRKSRLARANLSLLDISDKAIEVNRVFGANFALDKRLLEQIGYFPQNLGRVRGTLLSGEETELCKRAREQGLKVIYTPSAVVEHQIPPSRLTFKWMLRRMYYGGVSRAVRGGAPQPVVSKYNLYDYLFLILFLAPYLAGLLQGKLSRPE